MAQQIDNYWNRFKPEYVEVLVRDGYGTQASEINEIQSITDYRFKRVCSTLFKDGDVVSGATIIVDPETGKVTAIAGQVYLQGAIWDLPAAELEIPVTGSVAVGVYLQTSIISELEDPGLRNPAIGARGEGEPGAWRRRTVAVWGTDAEARDGDFYPVYTVEDGVQRAKEAPPNLDSFNQALARYDRDSTGTGTYAVSGLRLIQGDDLEDGRQVYHLSEGRARVDGLGVEIATSRRVIYPAQPDLRFVDTEIHSADGSGSQRIDVAHAPLKNVTAIRITAEKTATIVHGAYSGCMDDIPDTSVVKIVRIQSGDTVYQEGADYVRNGDRIDWSPAGNEMTPGSSYQCTYQHIAATEPQEQDDDGFKVAGAVRGTSIMVSYNQMLPRYDRLAITSEGELVWYQGVASESNAQKPRIPSSQLYIATVYQEWRRGPRTIINDAVRVVQFDEIEKLSERIDYAISEIARQRLEADVSTREGGARVGMFVDPLLDDSMRDQGVAQTGAVYDGILTLPVTNLAATHVSGDVKKPTALPYTVAVCLEQDFRTGTMKVNPYMAYDPLPAVVTLTPAVDRWTEVQTSWTSAVTKTVSVGSGNRYTTSTSSKTELVGATTKNIEYLRQIDVAFEISGFGAGEKLQSVVFDGVDVTSTVS